MESPLKEKNCSHKELATLQKGAKMKMAELLPLKVVGSLVVLDLMALRDSALVYFKPSPRER